MTDNNTALERIMSKRRRPAVSSRADVVSESLGQDVKTSLSQDSSDKRRDVVKTNSPQDMIEVVRSTTRLEKSVDTALRHLCTDERITKEVWFEAAYHYLS